MTTQQKKQEVLIKKIGHKYVLTIEDNQKVNELAFPELTIVDIAKGINHLSDLPDMPVLLMVAKDKEVYHFPVPAWAFEKVKYIIMEEALIKTEEMVKVLQEILSSFAATSAVSGSVPNSEIIRQAKIICRVLGVKVE